MKIQIAPESLYPGGHRQQSAVSTLVNLITEMAAIICKNIYIIWDSRRSSCSDPEDTARKTFHIIFELMLCSFHECPSRLLTSVIMHVINQNSTCIDKVQSHLTECATI